MNHRPPTMANATKKPIPDRMAKTGLTWALDPVVVKGRVDGEDGRWLPMAAMVVEVVEVVGTVANVRGTVGDGTVVRAGSVTEGKVVGGAVVGGGNGEVVGGATVLDVGPHKRQGPLVEVDRAEVLAPVGPAKATRKTVAAAAPSRTFITTATRRFMATL